MVNLNPLTTISAVKAITAASLLAIIDFQGNCVDAPGGVVKEFVGVETYPCGVPQWVFTQVGTNFQISSMFSATAILSAPLVGTSQPTLPLVYQQALIRTSSIMVFQLVPNFNFPGKFNIVSAVAQNGFQVALTSWPKRVQGPPLNSLTIDAVSAPLTYTQLNSTDPQQAFTLATSL